MTKELGSRRRVLVTGGGRGIGAAIGTFLAELEADAPFSALVHNAGQPYDSLAAVMDQTKAQAIMQVNFWSLTKLVGALVRPMTRARDGRIVVIGSIAALRANQGNAAYAASKAALLGYVRTLAIETHDEVGEMAKALRRNATKWRTRSQQGASPSPRRLLPWWPFCSLRSPAMSPALCSPLTADFPRR